MKNLTKAQLKSILKKHDYIVLRDKYGELHGINTKSMNPALRKSNMKDNDPTIYQSYRPVTFIEYIKYKIPFINS